MVPSIKHEPSVSITEDEDDTSVFVGAGQHEIHETFSIEVESVSSGGRPRDRILCVVPDEVEANASLSENIEVRYNSFIEEEKHGGSEAEDAIVGSAHQPKQTRSTDAYEQEGKEEDKLSPADSLMETLSFACLSTCGSACTEPFGADCGPLRTKSILRNRGSPNGGRNPNEAPILSDRQVSFSRLEIREFNMTLGNHPSAVSGPPVMLDWESQAQAKRVVDLDEYEKSRNPRRGRRELKLSYSDRKEVLLSGDGESGGKFSEEEVNSAWAEALQIRKQRQETLQRGLLLMFIDDVIESASRKYHRVLDYIGLA